MNDTARLGEPLAIGKLRPRIHHGDAESELVGEAGQRDRDMRSSEDEKLRRPRERLEGGANATNRILLLQQLGRSRIGGGGRPGGGPRGGGGAVPPPPARRPRGGPRAARGPQRR